MNTLKNWLRALLVVLAFAAFGGRASAEKPHVLYQSETGAATYRGTWTWDDSRGLYVGRWNNGAEATLRVVKNNGREIEFVRTDTNAAFTARYYGTKTGDQFRGTVDWTSGGKTSRGTWEAKLEMLPAKFGSVLTVAQANEVHKAMAAMKEIPWKYPVDGCYARAYLMVRKMIAMGVEPSKVWAFAPPGQTMEFTTPNHPDGRVRWRYHVAPTVRVKFPDGERDVVIDPALFDRPATIDYWRDSLKLPGGAKPHISKTRIGEPPTDATGKRLYGTGYVPGSDPADLDADVRRAMQEGFDVLAGRRAWVRFP